MKVHGSWLLQSSLVNCCEHCRQLFSTAANNCQQPSNFCIFFKLSTGGSRQQLAAVDHSWWQWSTSSTIINCHQPLSTSANRCQLLLVDKQKIPKFNGHWRRLAAVNNGWPQLTTVGSSWQQLMAVDNSSWQLTAAINRGQLLWTVINCRQLLSTAANHRQQPSNFCIYLIINWRQLTTAGGSWPQLTPAACDFPPRPLVFPPQPLVFPPRPLVFPPRPLVFFLPSRLCFLPGR